MNALECKFPAYDPMTRELAETGYYSKYVKACWGGIVPMGLDGRYLWDLRKELEPEYRRLHNTDGATEVNKIASFVMDKK
jgi:hypothetical protein